MQTTAARYEQYDMQLFEHDFEALTEPETVTAAAEATLTLTGLSMQFARVERVPRYDEASRENDAEHSYMLGLVANELAARYYPWLNRALVLEYSLVHDLIELETGDVATFKLSSDELAAKEAAEHQALQRLVDRLPATTAQAVVKYELQCDAEARFVRLVDKILPVTVDILGPGKKVMVEDYDITTRQQLDDTEARMSQKLQTRFDEPHLALLHMVRKVVAEQFSDQMEREMV